MALYRILDTLVVILMIIAFLVTVDVMVFQNSYKHRIEFLSCQFAGEDVTKGDTNDCCADNCYYHAGSRDSAISRFWNNTISVYLSYIFYPFVNPFLN